MKARIAIITAFLLMTFGCFWLAGACAQSIDSAIYVKQFPGATVGAKVTAAMKTCGTNTAVKCYLVIDPSLAAAATGTIPAMCSHCILLDYRSGFPTGNFTLPPPFAVDVTSNLCNAACDGHTDDHVKIQACLNAYPAVFIPISGGGGTQCNLGTVGLTLGQGNRIYGNGQFLGYTGNGIAVDAGANAATGVYGVFFDLTGATGTPTVYHNAGQGFLDIQDGADQNGPVDYLSVDLIGLVNVSNYIGGGGAVSNGANLQNAIFAGDVTIKGGSAHYLQSFANCTFDGNLLTVQSTLCQGDMTIGDPVQVTYGYNLDIRNSSGTITWAAGGESNVFGKVATGAMSYAMVGAPTSGFLQLAKWNGAGYDTEQVTYPPTNAGVNYDFTYTTCTVPSGGDSFCTGTITFTSGGNTTPSFPALADANYTIQCGLDVGTTGNPANTAFTWNAQGLNVDSLGYAVGNTVQAMGSGQAFTGMCRLHHN